jgi:pyruvate dehydrogenase E2 component (dihydrolipoamide acetyltransferase)
MSRRFTLPDLGEGLTEAEIVRVLVREGDTIQEDAPLLEVETDKARVEIPSPMSGRVETIHVRAGQAVKVGEALITFADPQAGTGGEGAGAPSPKSAPEPSTRTTGGLTAPEARGRERAPEMPQAGAQTGVTDGRARPAPVTPVAGTQEAFRAPAEAGPVPATPATRRLARELSVDLRTVRPSGPGGRVTDDDVRAAAEGSRSGPPTGREAPAVPAGRSPGAAAHHERAIVRAEKQPAEPAPVGKPLAGLGVEPPPLPKFEQWGPVERAPLSHLRRTIAERMALSATLVPHVTHFDRADITDLDAVIRRNLERAQARGVTLTLTGFLLKAAALALRGHPQFNASLDPGAGELILKRYYHLGIAVATERGLIVPVIRDVDKKPLLELARELGTLAQRVREGKATLEDLRGGTFTITNIGALGGTGAIPIINYPEVAILGVARGREEPVVRDGQIVPRLLLPLSLTFDHRIADGADGARFAGEVVRLLEHPDQLLLEL